MHFVCIIVNCVAHCASRYYYIEQSISYNIRHHIACRDAASTAPEPIPYLFIIAIQTDDSDTHARAPNILYVCNKTSDLAHFAAY